MLKELPLYLFLGLASASCDATQLYIVHHTIVGLDAAVNSQQTSGHIVIGYDRNFAAFAPSSVPLGAGKEGGEKPIKTAENSPKARDAMAVLSCSYLEIDGIYLTEFTEHLATGSAARKFAKQSAKDGKTQGSAGDFYRCSSDR